MYLSDPRTESDPATWRNKIIANTVALYKRRSEGMPRPVVNLGRGRVAVRHWLTRPAVAVVAGVRRWSLLLLLVVVSSTVASTGCSGPESAETVFSGPNLLGGAVEVVASTPKAVAVGTGRELVRWTSTNNATEPHSFIYGEALDGLPAGCVIPGVEIWEDVEDEFNAGAWPTFPNQTVEAGSDGATAVVSRDVGPACVGSVEIVLVVKGAGVDSTALLQRVTLELKS